MPRVRLEQRSLVEASERSIKAAGARYTPDLDPSAPNLTIASLVSAVDAVGLTSAYRAAMTRTFQRVVEVWNDVPDSIRALFQGSRYGIADSIMLTERLTREAPGHSNETLEELRRADRCVNEVLSARRDALWKQQRESHERSEQQGSIEHEISWVRKLQSSLDGVNSFLNGPDANLVTTNRLFIRGDWGTGKTHFLCDVTRLRIASHLPTLFILAHHLRDGINLTDSICEAAGTTRSINSLLQDLNRLGRRSGSRTLLIIDGINEGDRPMWRAGVADLAQRVSQYAHVGLVLSCRSPFEMQILTKRSRGEFVIIPHRGFSEIEFDAQNAFFNHYGIPTPHVPLLSPEYTRPLFLKMMCETFAGLTRTSKSRRINQIAAGQKGMTKLLEDFVSKVGRHAETDFGLPPKTCWNILKGIRSPLTRVVTGVAPTMAAKLQDYVSPRDLRSIVRDITGMSKAADVRRFCRRIINDGLLTEDSLWQNSAWVEIIRLPYQRFSDHLICRHLLDQHLGGLTNATAIKRAFYSNRPLGKVFKVDRFGRNYAMPGLASAIMLEFPERVKRACPNDRELVHFLPKRNRLAAPFVDAFIEGLLWRDLDSFSQGTDALVGFVLNAPNERARHGALEALTCLASRPGHTYSAERLRRYLLPMAMPERDVFWSEFLRTSQRDGTVYKILDWVDRPDASSLTNQVAENLLRLCSLFLTTTHKALRDRATRIIVLLGEKHPSQLFTTVIESFELNDPYVRERMLAAAYGVVMRCWAFPSPALKRSVGEFARHLYDLMFQPNAPYATKHILMQDFALGIIELGRKIDARILGRRMLSRLKRPFSDPPSIPDASEISERECASAEGAIHMDFENYTVGGLIEGRGNYDSENVEYKRVLRQIKWRIVNLGYSDAIFKNIDSSINQQNLYSHGRGNDGTKIDRYGKKYSWISYYEVCGMRADEGKLPDLQDSPRVTDIDIDPSFPRRQEWMPPLRPLFESPCVSVRQWIANGAAPSYKHLLNPKAVDSIQGPWVLLNGFIQESAPEDPRQVFTFLRGLLVSVADRADLTTRLYEIEYPGNNAIPDGDKDYYTFAGEIPWSRNFGYPRTKSGKAKRSQGRVFDKYVATSARVPFDKLSLWEQRRYLLDETSETVRNEIPKFVTIERHSRIPGIRVELPIHGFSWESYHSTENEGGGAEYPAPAICDHLSLRNRGDSMDLNDMAGNTASVYRQFGEREYSKSHLLYLRKDLLDRYLADTGQCIVWIIWGEREVKYGEFERYKSEIHAVWPSYKHVHRTHLTEMPPVSAP